LQKRENYLLLQPFKKENGGIAQMVRVPHGRGINSGFITIQNNTVNVKYGGIAQMVRVPHGRGINSGFITIQNNTVNVKQGGIAQMVRA